MKTKHLVTLLAVAATGLTALVLLPLRGQGAGECCNAATSLAATVNAPVIGDQAFFNLPNGPSNVMFLVDNSGSMDNIVQCVDSQDTSVSPAVTAWGGDSKAAKCQWPTSTELPKPASGIKGTCSFTSSSALAWMTALKDPTGAIYTKTTAPAVFDPGRGTSSSDALTDIPSWGSTCTGNNCLFTKGKIYKYGGWDEGSAPILANCNSSGLAGTLSAADLITCNDCLANQGFYFLQNSAGKRQVLFDGWWLNANPPKFMTARKVIKNTIWMDKNDLSIDSTTRANLDAARFGLAVINGTRIVVPLGPDKTHSFDSSGIGTNAVVNRAATVEVRQKIIDALNRSGTGFPTLANGGTALASALIDLGNYYSGKMASTASTWELTAGSVVAPWAGAGTPQCTFCWGCQNSAILVVTDGSPNTEPATGDALPATYNGVPTAAAWSSYDEASYVSNCGTKAGGYINCVSPSMTKPTYMPRVASWLFNVDKRSEMTLPPNQTVMVSTIGYGILSNFTASSALWNILNATANLGGGTAYDATTPGELADKIASAVNDVVQRANSFSAPAASSLSTIHTAASEVFVTRFKPNDFVTWEGHVYQWLLFDEALNGCDPTKTPGTQTPVTCRTKTRQPNFNGNADSRGLNICTDVFLIDTDCDEVSENVKTGVFEKKGTGGTVAKPVWDAGRVLSCKYTDSADNDATCKLTSGTARPGYRTAVPGQTNSRTIWTWVNGAKVSVEPANVGLLQPFMSMTKQWCFDNLPLTKLCGASSGVACPISVAAVTAAQLTQCATAVINFVRGYDVMDADVDGCGGPGVSGGCPGSPKTDGEERDPANWSKATTNAFWKLGDVFHSSPVLVKPPVSQVVCDTGYDNQCVPTLRSPVEFSSRATQTQIDSYSVTSCTPSAGAMTVDAYGKYWYDGRKRQRQLLVGANDGMLHAFDSGTVPTGATPDPQTCEYTFNQGTGEELWAFVPTDLVPRLKDLLTGHQYMVDGSTMLRDIWVDNAGAGAGSKQSNEFHTVAILTERTGGTQVTALDVTDPANPTVRWSFPPPCSDDQKYMAQSWSDFAPRPPPIGPVRFKATGGDPAPDQSRGFLEKWVVMINGGYDPAMAAGAAVWMLDAWTGQVYWRYTNDTFKSQFTYLAGTSMFSVPGAVALADVGDTDKAVSDSDGFFDTAVWGDVGGNLFVARFQEPGDRDTGTGLVKNWYAARTFEEQRRTDNLQYATGRSEFFFMPELAYEPSQRALHAYLGSGNRERMMQMGQACGPDNLMACCKAGCTTVSATVTDNYGACSQVAKFTCAGGQLNVAPTTSTCGATAACGSGADFTAKVDLAITCPLNNAITPPGGVFTMPSPAPIADCDANGLCAAVPPMGAPDVKGNYNGTCTKSRFYGMLAYGGYPEKKFTTLADTKVFEKARFTDVPYVADDCLNLPGTSCSLINTTKAKAVVGANLPDCTAAGARCYAQVTDPGWYFQYGDVCPTSSCPDFGTCSSEKTGSGGLVTFGCLLWNGFQPLGGNTGAIDPCGDDKQGVPLAYGYASDYVQGVPKGSCGFSSASTGGTLYRAQQRASVSPPSAPLLRITAGARGGVQYSGLQLDPGAPPTNTVAGSRSDFAESVYWLEVPRELHSCRHDPASANLMCPGAK